MSSERFDLHVHSTASDGALSPRELVALAADRGLAGLALADHDTVAGLDQAQAMAATLGIRCLSGVEISCTSVHADTLHLLGYCFDPAHPALARLLADLHRERARDAAAAVPIEVAIDAVHLAGGAAVLAHPATHTDHHASEVAIRHAAAAGLDGIEVDHPDHSEDAVRRCAALAVELDLVQTAGSDDHGSGVDGPRLGCRTTSARDVARLEARAAQWARA